MFTPGGQPDRFVVARGGGGKGGGGGSSAPAPLPPTVLTDPVNGKTFIQQPASPGADALYAAHPELFTQPPGGSAADQLNAEIAQRQGQEKTDSETLAAQKKADADAAETKFQGTRQTAYDNAMQNVMRQFQLQGVDPTPYMDSDITPALQKQFRSVQDLDPNPEAAFTPDLANNIITNLTAGKRTQAGSELNKIFTPTYSQNALPDSLTGQYQDTLLNEQFNPLQAQLTNAQKRGTLSQGGYQAALDALNQKRTAAGTTIQNLGSNILSADRKGIDDYISGARSDVNALGLSGTFDPSTYGSTAAGKVQTDVGAFGGALRNAVGDTKFADIQDLINAGGAVQGSQNPNAANPVAGGGAIPVDPQDTVKRGLGSTGAF